MMWWKAVPTVGSELRPEIKKVIQTDGIILEEADEAAEAAQQAQETQTSKRQQVVDMHFSSQADVTNTAAAIRIPELTARASQDT